MHLVLDLRAMPDDLIPLSRQRLQPLGLRIRKPNLGQEVRRPQRCQHAAVDLVGLDPCVLDRLDLQRVGDDHAGDMGAQHPNHGHGISGRLDDYLVLAGQCAAEARKA